MEFSFTNWTDAVYTKEAFLVDDEGKPKHLPWEDWREGTTSTPRGGCGHVPPASAAFEHPVQWSGQLGFGARSPEGGETGHRVNAATGSTAAPRHPRAPPPPGPSARGQAGPPRAIGRTLDKAEPFDPGAGKKHREKAHADQAAAEVAADTELPRPHPDGTQRGWRPPRPPSDDA